jgi:hypothetical protein
MKSTLRRWMVLAAVITSATVGIVGSSATSAAASGATEYTVEAFRETIQGWDSVSIPSASCGDGWLTREDLAPGRIVPRGVEVIEPGLVGVSIPWNQTRYWEEGPTLMSGVHGIDGLSATATNWDPLQPRELVVRLHCTTDRTKANLGPMFG